MNTLRLVPAAPRLGRRRAVPGLGSILADEDIENPVSSQGKSEEAKVCQGIGSHGKLPAI